MSRQGDGYSKSCVHWVNGYGKYCREVSLLLFKAFSTFWICVSKVAENNAKQISTASQTCVDTPLALTFIKQPMSGSYAKHPWCNQRFAWPPCVCHLHLSWFTVGLTATNTIRIFLGDAGAPIGPSFRTKKTSTYLHVSSCQLSAPLSSTQFARLHFIILCLGRSIGAHSCSVASWPCPWYYSCLGSPLSIDFSLSNLQ